MKRNFDMNPFNINYLTNYAEQSPYSAYSDQLSPLKLRRTDYHHTASPMSFAHAIAESLGNLSSQSANVSLPSSSSSSSSAAAAATTTPPSSHHHHHHHHHQQQQQHNQEQDQQEDETESTNDIQETGVQCEMGVECLRYLQSAKRPQPNSLSSSSTSMYNSNNSNYSTNNGSHNNRNHTESPAIDLSSPTDSTADLFRSLSNATATPISPKSILSPLLSSGSSGNGRIVNWSNHETLIFLNLCIEHDVPGQMQEKFYRFSKVFFEISKKMLRLGYQRTTTQLKDKYKTLKCRYNKGDVNGLEYESVQCLDKLFGNSMAGNLLHETFATENTDGNIVNPNEPHIEILEENTL